MNTRSPLLSSRPMLCAALTVAALAATGCAAPGDPALERVAEAEASLETQIVPGLIQLRRAGQIVGYGYTQVTSPGHSLQRFLIYNDQTPPVSLWNDVTFEAYLTANPNDPPELAPPTVPATLQGWTTLVTQLWTSTKIYAVCVSDLREQGGTYDGVPWDELPAIPPPSFPAWDPAAGWHGYTPPSFGPPPPRPAPASWPPGHGTLDVNVPFYWGQLDSGDGKVWQELSADPSIELGLFHAKGSVFDELNAEYVFMEPGYQAAGSAGYSTRLLQTAPQWDSPEEFWDDLTATEAWVPGAAVAINGCVYKHGGAQPSQL